MSWLLDRLLNHQPQPDPQFAFQGTVNWMRALAVLIDNNNFESVSLSQFYKNVQRRQPHQEQDTLAFECLLMALHNVACLKEFEKIESKYSVVRAAIIAWYYSIYYSSKSMLASANGCDPQTHSKTARIFQTEVVDRDLILFPFTLSITNLTPKNIIYTVCTLRGDNQYNLNTNPPYTEEQAHGAIISYLKGTAEHEKERIEKIVKSSKEFKELKVANFRTNNAKEVRDKVLTGRHVNILVQAFRYRGKANYRDSIYLSYGTDNSETLDTFVTDLVTVANTFVFMVSHYVPRRVECGSWSQFREDLTTNARFELPFDIRQI